MDARDLNNAIKRPHHPLPVIEDMLGDLANAKVFSVVDVKNGFWHVEFTKESSLLTTFNTPFGRFRWLRMPFGINAASEEFQRRMNEIVEGLNGVKVIVDDILIVGRGQTKQDAILDHDQNLLDLLNRLQERNVKLNPDKIKFKTESVPYIGHLITSEGLKSDPLKTEAIVKMP